MDRNEKSKWEWLPYVLPFAVFMLVGSVVDPLTSTESASRSNWMTSWLTIDTVYRYPIGYSLRIFLTIAALLLAGKVLRSIPLRCNPLAIGVGVLGFILWIVLCNLHLETQLAESIGLGESWSKFTSRSGYDPITELETAPGILIAFFAIRLLGLVVVVPVIEELFLRGFLVRFFVREEWWRINLRDTGPLAYAICAAYGALTHPGEAIAAIVWFSLVTWLMLRTGNLWDCIVAHATTNLLLGVYVVTYRQWWLW